MISCEIGRLPVSLHSIIYEEVRERLREPLNKSNIKNEKKKKQPRNIGEATHRTKASIQQRRFQIQMERKNNTMAKLRRDAFVQI